MRMKKSLALTLFLGLFLLGFLTYKKFNTVKFTILHTNDHHGRFWSDSKGRFGMAARSTIVNQIRKEAKKKKREFLLLSAGDINTGTFESDLLKAKPDFLGMNKIGYDAMTLGNHEFDNSLDELREQEQLADFPFLAANIFEQKTGKRLFKPYLKLEKSGVKLIIYGLTTETTPSRPVGEVPIEFRDPVEVASEELPLLRASNDIIIGLTHLGCYHDNPSLIDKTGDIHLLKNTKGFDMIIGGHSQIALEEPVYVEDIPITQAKEYGEYIGRIDFEYFGGKVQNYKYELIPVKDIEEDQEVKSLLKPYLEQAKGLGERVIAKSSEFFIGKDREVVRRKEAALGNLIGAAYRDKTKADISIIGGGAIRNDLDEGDITFKEVREILPFGNTLTTATLSAEQLKQYLTPIVKLANGEKNGAFPQMSGVQVFVNNEKMITKILVGGLETRSDKKYKIVMDSYLATREKQYPRLNEYESFIDTGYVDYLSFIEFLKKKKIIEKKQYAPTGDIVVQ